MIAVITFVAMTRRSATVCLILAIVNSLCFFLMWNSQRPIDYHAFYSAGRLANESLRTIYNLSAQRSMLTLFRGEKGFLPYYHPPHELLLFGPLARLPYAISLAVWEVMGIGFLLASTRLLSKILEIPWPHVTVLSFALFATGFSFYEGQDTILLVFLLSSAFFLLHRNLEVSAATVLALALFKPQIPVVIAFALLVSGRWRFFRAFVACAFAIAAGSFFLLGEDGFRQWLSLLTLNEGQEQAWRMLSLRGLLSLMHAPHALDIAAAGTLILIFAARWWRGHDLSLVFSSAIVVGSLTAFHFHAYDGAVLLIPFTYLIATSELDWLDHSIIAALCASPLFFALSMVNKSALLCIPILILSAKFWIRLEKGRDVIASSSALASPDDAGV